MLHSIAGDINIDYIYKDLNPIHIDMLKKYKLLVIDNNYEQHIDQVTRRTEGPRNSNGGTCLDHIITNKHFKPEKTIVLDVVDKKISDHHITITTGPLNFLN